MATIETRTGYARLPVGSAAVNYSAITLRPDGDQAPRPQVQLALVIDTSGSMGGILPGGSGQKKIDLVREAAQTVIASLDDADYLTIVAFSDMVEVLSQPRQIGQNRQALLQAVGALRDGGGTLMGEGIATARRELLGIETSGAAVRKLVVLTDGQTNDENYCHMLASSTEVPFMLGGIGDDYNGALLEEMARQSRGESDYIDRAEKVSGFFGEVLASISSVVMTNAVLAMSFRQRFRPLRVHQVAPHLQSYDFTPVTATNRVARVSLGDVQKEGLTLLVHYAYEGGAGFASEFQVAGLDLSYDRPPRSGLTSQSDNFTIVLSDQAGFPDLDPVVKGYVDYAEVESSQTRMLQAARVGDASSATRHLHLLQENLERVGADPSFIEQTVQTMRLTLEATGDASQVADSSATKRLTSGTRKLTVTPDQQ